MPFVALEVIGIAAADPPPFHLLLAKPVDELALDELRLRVSKEGDHAKGLAVVAWISA